MSMRYKDKDEPSITDFSLRQYVFTSVDGNLQNTQLLMIQNAPQVYFPHKFAPKKS